MALWQTLLVSVKRSSLYQYSVKKNGREERKCRLTLKKPQVSSFIIFRLLRLHHRRNPQLAIAQITPRIARPTRVVTKILPGLDPSDARKLLAPLGLPELGVALGEELAETVVEVMLAHWIESEHSGVIWDEVPE